jgi:hypothetical protein
VISDQFQSINFGDLLRTFHYKITFRDHWFRLKSWQKPQQKGQLRGSKPTRRLWPSRSLAVFVDAASAGAWTNRSAATSAEADGAGSWGWFDILGWDLANIG